MLQNVSKPVKILLITIISFVVIYIVLYVLIKHYVTTHNLKSMIINAAQNSLQRKITVDDDIKFSLGWNLQPRIGLSNLVVSNPDWASQEHMLTVADIDLKLNLLELWHKKLDIMHLDLHKINLNLETLEAQNNWTFNKDTSNDSSSVKLSINEITIKDGIIAYFANKVLANKLVMNDLVVNADSDMQEFDIKFDGIFNRIPVKTKFSATVSDEKFALEIHNFSSGSSDIQGDLSIDYNKMNIDGHLSSKRLVLQEIMPQSESSDSENYSIPDIQFPVDKLKTADFDVKIKVDELVLPKLTLNDVTIKTKNEDQVLTIVLDPSAKVVNGKLDASLTYDLKPTTPNMQLKINTTALSLEQLISEHLNTKSPISGSDLNFSLNLTGSGSDLKDIVATMQGKILATASAGVYHGSASGSITAFLVNIVTSLISFDKTNPITKFSCIVINFNVKQGIANSNNGLALEASTVKAQGSGTINFNNGALNLTITPYNNITGPINLSQFSLAQAVSITGTIDDPSVSLNPLGNLTNDPSAIGKTLLKGITGLSAGLSVGATAIASDLLDTKKANTVTPCKTAMEQ